MEDEVDDLLRENIADLIGKYEKRIRPARLTYEFICAAIAVALSSAPSEKEAWEFIQDSARDLFNVATANANGR